MKLIKNAYCNRCFAKIDNPINGYCSLGYGTKTILRKGEKIRVCQSSCPRPLTKKNLVEALIFKTNTQWKH